MNGIATIYYREKIFSGRTGKLLSQEVPCIKLLDIELLDTDKINVILLEDCYKHRRGQIVSILQSDYKDENCK